MNLALILVTHALMQSASIGQLPVARESADSNKSALRREATTLSGLPGLITAPVAATIPAGMLDIGFSNARTPSAYSGLGTQQSYVIAVGFLPRVSLSLRGTVFGRDANRTADCNCDLSESIQVQLLTEGDWRPSIAVGAQDPLSAARNFETRYVVASKSLLGRLRLTAGYGSGPTVLKGAFGGAEVNVASWATALGEYDGSKYAAALRLQPFPATALTSSGGKSSDYRQRSDSELRWAETPRQAARRAPVRRVLCDPPTRRMNRPGRVRLRMRARLQSACRLNSSRRDSRTCARASTALPVARR
jgi:hypothetical protein